ncbi:protein-tyrosine phosphatase [Metarhizium guizhouense ARSEF 977]|uniref:Protein-tyrosine phosphatase n=1 Tax=Metarhizium guizhouense (strain ARSEF 977) TaxID=1276136 RepID=A0A0B4HNQ6_METGA|nr:protein-tyrosine phosphatase [Metarhizium guizhouense ARSEF 977]
MESNIRRQTSPPPGGFVYRGDSRSPQEIRGTGGFRPQGDGWENHDSSFDLTRHYTAGPNGCGLDDSDEPGFVFRTAYVSTAQERGTAENYGQWLYEIRATPNILDNDDAESEVMALGGLHWRQVRRYTRMRDTDNNRVDESRWIDNPEYDAQSYERGEHARLCRVSTSFPGVLAGESDSDSSGEADAQRHLFNSADRWMDQTDGIYELYGAFPPTWTEYAPREDIPGPDHPAPPEAEDAQGKSPWKTLWASLRHVVFLLTTTNEVGALLQHYIDMGAQELDRLFPDGNQVLQELFRDIQPIGCPSLSGFGSHLGRPDRRGSGVQILHPCKKIKNIEFGLNLANEYWGLGGEGTWDDIGGILEGKAGKAEFKIAEQPALGSSWWTPVKFPSDTIDITGIDKLSLTAEPHLWRWAQRDWFKVKDIRIRAQCADPGFEAKNDKYVGISQWYRHNGGGAIWQEPFTKKAVATLPIHPGDWTFAPPCNIIKDLSYEFTLANGWGDGTGDKLTLILGEGIIFLGNSFKAGSTIKDKIDIKKTFNKDTIDIRDLKTVAIGDDNSGAGLFDKSWTLQAFPASGVTFSATCADVSKKMQMKKFASENKEVSHKDNGPAWTGNIDAADWVEVA